MVQGQINRGSKLGEIIYELAKKQEVKTVVEIGTWSGMGSTKCILDGVLSKRGKTDVYSLECNKMRYEEAKTNLGFLPPSFKLIHGTIVDASELRPMLQTLDNETLKGWLEEDLGWLQVTPNVLEMLPETIDLFVLDGGEFSAKKEFELLWNKCLYIVLDDTNAIKNKDTKRFILSKPDVFEIIEDNVVDRNGYLVCKNKTN